MDLSKAFDTLNINILLSKLNHYGIKGIENQWFSSYLKERIQYVEIEGHQSLNLCKDSYSKDYKQYAIIFLE